MFKKIIGVAFLLFSLLLLIYGLYFFGLKMWGLFSSVDPKLGAGLVTAFATIFVSVLSVLTSKYLERKSEVQAQLREKKVPTYEKLMDFMFKMTVGEKLGGKKFSSNEKQVVLTEIVQELIIWGSDDMLHAFYNFRHGILSNKENIITNKELSENKGLPTLYLIEEILIAIRKDLGHKNKGVRRGKILGMLVNDLPQNTTKT
ncbi:hypothetical protein [Paraglaciecola arctica]|uniref:hypothetical protein n=1 Tax=Paraglaciecola arctica TaxID=1128911 RepID=UPI001C07D346|nr:hypothetical protein [Paraglaciecola arctica]MBU3006163.1 hypothetical protein [Paraglaciecola arctica]